MRLSHTHSVILGAAKDLTERYDTDRVAGVRSFAPFRGCECLPFIRLSYVAATPPPHPEERSEAERLEGWRREECGAKLGEVMHFAGRVRVATLRDAPLRCAPQGEVGVQRERANWLMVV